MSTIVCTVGGFLAGGDSQLQPALTFRLMAAMSIKLFRTTMSDVKLRQESIPHVFIAWKSTWLASWSTRSHLDFFYTLIFSGSLTGHQLQNLSHVLLIVVQKWQFFWRHEVEWKRKCLVLLISMHILYIDSLRIYHELSLQLITTSWREKIHFEPPNPIIFPTDLWK